MDIVVFQFHTSIDNATPFSDMLNSEIDIRKKDGYEICSMTIEYDKAISEACKETRIKKTFVLVKH